MEKNLPESLQDVIESIDKEIQHSHDDISELASLRRRRNSLMPIFRLPEEIIAEIFLLNVLAGCSDYNYIWELCPDRRWTNVATVCKYWREIALDYPELWSHWGSTMSSRWLELFASRSNTVPLHLRFSDMKLIQIKSWKTIISDPAVRVRIHEIHAEGVSWKLGAIFSALEYHTVENVEHESLLQNSPIRSLLIRHTIVDEDEYDVWPYPPELPMRFISSNFPHLQNLELTECDFDWDHPIFKSSSMIKLEITKPDNTGCPSMTQILSILASQPNLQRLVLADDAIPTSTHMTSEIVADLRHLNYVRFSGRLEGCTGIMRRLSFSRNSTTVSLKFDYPHPDVKKNVSPIVVPFMFDYFSHSESPKIGDSFSIHTLSISDIYDLTIVCWPHYSPPSLTSFSKPTTSFKIPGHLQFCRSHVEAMKALLSALPLANLCKLSMAGIEILPSEWRSAVFACMNGLEELELRYDKTQTAVVALIPGQIDDQRSEDGDSGVVSGAHSTAAPDIPLPNLKHLDITGADLLPTLFQGISLSVALLRCVEGRSLAGHPLNSVALRGCRCSSEVRQPPVVETARQWTEVKWENW